MHTFAHAAPTHANGVQFVKAPATHRPAPSHWLDRLSVAGPLHEADLHVVPATHFWHWPAPLHTPVRPQVEASCAVQSLCGSLFDATLPHVPSVPAPLSTARQLWHAPLHAV